MNTVDAVVRTLESPNVCDSNHEAANVVDVISALSNSTMQIAHAITANAAPGHDAQGGYVGSLTEAVMGLTSAMADIASAIQAVADAQQTHADADDG